MNIGDLVKVEDADAVGLVTRLDSGVYTIEFSGDEYPDFYCTLEFVLNGDVTILSPIGAPPL